MVKKYLIKRSQVVAILIFLVEIIGSFALVQIDASENILGKIGYVAIIYGVLSTIALYQVKKEWDVFLIFMIMCYLFSFGQCILTAFGYKLGVFVFSMDRGFFSNQEILNASVFCFIAIALTGIGFCFHRSSIKYEKLSNKPVLTDNVLCRVAWGLLLISVVPTFYELYKDVTTVFFNGYSDTLGNATGIDKIFVLISGFYPSAILILYCFEKKRRRMVYFALGSYVLLQLLGGSRIAVFRLAIVLLVISNLYRKEISKKRAVMICIFGLVGVFVFSFVSSARNYIYLASNVQLFLKETATDLLENNFIFAAIKEMGNTQVINTLVYALCPKKVDYRYGMSFVRSIYSVLPNFLNLEYISIDEVFSPYYTVTNAGCGASFIAEGYWNFGYFSVLFFIALGYVWGTLSNRFKQLCNSKYVKPENFFVIVYLMYYMIFLVRSESIELGRSFVYYAVIPILISKLLKTKTVRGGVRQAKEWLAYVHSYIDSIPQKLCDAVSYCYLFEREVAV